MKVDIKAFTDQLNLTTLSPSSKTEWDLYSADLNRPGLQLSGFYEYFAYERPQVIGLVEMSYLASLPKDVLRKRLETYFSYDLPCVIVCRKMTPPQELIELARARDIPVFGTDKQTTTFSVSAITYLSRCLAPRSSMHGVLLDVYGVGILITGDSGAGKSEAALELIKRGHQLVADDRVDIVKVADNMLIGESPATIRHLMEIRGIGVIDIKAMFGIGAVLTTKSIDLVIQLENWKEDKAYERLGLTDTYTTIMDVDIAKILMPVRPGRNLAIIIEVAARNFSLKRMGYSAARELDQRINDLRNKD
ncbi:MAG: HPr kinase/phosphorylase [Clostridia bacterium]|nr:HPr kinase/phosphorylase [Clostridia bacterium]